MSQRRASTRRISALVTSAVSAGALVVGTLALAAGPAQAATWSGYGTGPVGVPQTINVQGICPGNELSFSATYSNGTISTANPVMADSNGNATITWTPTTVGLITQATVGSTCDPVLLGGANITQVSTTTTVSAPNNATVGQAIRVQVTVQSQSPSAYSPTGQITVVNANNAAVSNAMGLTPGPGNGQSFAYFWWTPTASGTYYFQARYGGDTNASASPMSPTDTVIATTSGSTIAITAPGTLTQGQTVTLIATVYPIGTQGSVGFTVNGSPISASIPINAQGQASFPWTPPMAGNVQLGANYTTNQGGSGSTSQPITINSGPAQQDSITLIQPGWGPWQPNGTYTLGNGTNFTFQASSLSGAAVTLSESGPCGLSGLTLNIPVGTGQCNLQASTNGGNGYAPVKYGYTISMVPGTQTANVVAPQSGRYNRGRTLTLEGAGNGDTNAGQNINWRVTRGRGSVCTLRFRSDNSVQLRLVGRGQCIVRGTAAGVPGQWNAYSVQRAYRAF